MPAELSSERLLEILRRMLRIRHFEERVVQRVDKGEALGFVHPYVGVEAVAMGVCAALRNDDYMVGNHRSHGHPIAKGAHLKQALAEILGKATGYCKGKGGSMHLADFSVGILGVGRIAQRPVAYRGAIALRSTVWLSLTFDHRAVDGAPAAAFLKALKGRLQHIAWLVA